MWDLTAEIASRKPDYEFAKIAIDSYLAAVAKELYEDDYDCFTACERALDVAQSLKDEARIDAARAAFLKLHRNVISEGRPLWWKAPDRLLTDKFARTTEGEKQELASVVRDRRHIQLAVVAYRPSCPVLPIGSVIECLLDARRRHHEEGADLSAFRVRSTGASEPRLLGIDEVPRLKDWRMTAGGKRVRGAAGGDSARGVPKEVAIDVNGDETSDSSKGFVNSTKRDTSLGWH